MLHKILRSGFVPDFDEYLLPHNFVLSQRDPESNSFGSCFAILTQNFYQMLKDMNFSKAYVIVQNSLFITSVFVLSIACCYSESWDILIFSFLMIVGSIFLFGKCYYSGVEEMLEVFFFNLMRVKIFVKHILPTSLL